MRTFFLFSILLVLNYTAISQQEIIGVYKIKGHYSKKEMR